LNAVKSGTRLTRLTLGCLPQRMLRQTRMARKYRRGLEQLVMTAKGEVDAVDAHLIDEASGAETHASICRWLLRERLDTMTVADITRCSEGIMRARAIRNRAVERLNLNAPAALPWQVIDQPKEDESQEDEEEGEQAQ
jgi:hypothetical protein